MILVKKSAACPFSQAQMWCEHVLLPLFAVVVAAMNAGEDVSSRWCGGCNRFLKERNKSIRENTSKNTHIAYSSPCYLLLHGSLTVKCVSSFDHTVAFYLSTLRAMTPCRRALKHLPPTPTSPTRTLSGIKT